MNWRAYYGSISVDSSRLDSLSVGDTIKLRNGATGTITYVQPSPYQLHGTGTLSNGRERNRQLLAVTHLGAV